MEIIYILKTFSRLFHLLSGGFFLGQVFNIFAVLTCGTPDTTGTLQVWMWVLSVITGLGNMIILIMIRKPQKEAHSLWKYLLYAKLVLWLLLLSPLLNWLLALVSTPSSQTTAWFQLWLVLAMLCLSVGARFYREDVTKGFTIIPGQEAEFRKFDEGH